MSYSILLSVDASEYVSLIYWTESLKAEEVSYQERRRKINVSRI